MPSLRKKNAGELVQKLVPGKIGGWKDAQYAPAARPSPIAASARFTRLSAAGVRVRASQTPTAAPAARKPAHGNNVNVVAAPPGRKYHSTASGRMARAGVAR